MRKLCKICLEVKDYELFSKNCVNEDGLSHMCKECCSAYRKFLREKHKKRGKNTFGVARARDFSVCFE